MDFLGIGGGEIFMILVVALLVLGPGKIVEVSRSLGKIVHSLKNTTSEFTNQISKELEVEQKEKIAKADQISKGPDL